MSFDLHVYIRSTAFPEDVFLSVLADFGETDEQQADRFGRHWRTIIDESSMFCTVTGLRPEEKGNDLGFGWRIGVYVNSGCTPRARWSQFAMVFRSILLIPGSIASDPQTGTYFDQVEDFVEFSQEAFQRWPKLVRKLKSMDLATSEGQPLF